jgi:lipopolysaccharide biosynthesis glycosyltransferase
MWDTSLFEGPSDAHTANGFVFIDSDIIMIRNCDELVDAIAQNGDCSNEESSSVAHAWENGVHAVSNFRKKKKSFPMEPSANFNSGMMVVVNPTDHDWGRIYDALCNFDPQWPQADESLLNSVYKNEWKPLQPTYNLQKRCFVHATALFASLQHEIRMLHYVGGKPWQNQEELKRDWESSDGYIPLFNIWSSVRQHLYSCPGELAASVDAIYATTSGAPDG